MKFAGNQFGILAYPHTFPNQIQIDYFLLQEVPMQSAQWLISREGIFVTGNLLESWTKIRWPIRYRAAATFDSFISIKFLVLHLSHLSSSCFARTNSHGRGCSFGPFEQAFLWQRHSCARLCETRLQRERYWLFNIMKRFEEKFIRAVREKWGELLEKWEQSVDLRRHRLSTALINIFTRSPDATLMYFIMKKVKEIARARCTFLCWMSISKIYLKVLWCR